MANPTHFLGREIQVERLVTTRLFSLFSPCVWGTADTYVCSRWFLHGTYLGGLVVRLFWFLLNYAILASIGLFTKELESAKPGFELVIALCKMEY